MIRQVFGQLVRKLGSLVSQMYPCLINVLVGSLVGLVDGGLIRGSKTTGVGSWEPRHLC